MLLPAERAGRCFVVQPERDRPGSFACGVLAGDAAVVAGLNPDPLGDAEHRGAAEFGGAIGEATVLEVVDAQNSLTLAELAQADGNTRYQLSLANLQLLTGTI